MDIYLQRRYIMMKMYAKKFLSLVLCLLMLLSSVSLAASAQNDDFYPIVYVHGFMASDINADKTDRESELYFPMSATHIVEGVVKAVPALAKLILCGDWDSFGNAVSPVLESIFYGLYNDPDGGVSDGSGTFCRYPSKEEILYTDRVDFKYDWRTDPIDIAAELNDYIEYVKETADVEKVYISCHSLGGVIVLSYLTLYGEKSVAGVGFDSTAIYGETYTGDLLSGKIEISSESVLYAIENMVKGNDAELVVDSLLEIFEKAGLFSLIAYLGNDIVEHTKLSILEAMGKLFGSWLTIWAMVPDEQIDEAMSFAFGEIYDRNDPEISELIGKIENYNNVVRKSKAQTLKKLDKESRVVVISRYGFASIAATPSWNNMSDNTVDTRNNSFGATTATYGTCFDEAYLEGKDMKYISPDKTIDASTCLFPDKTWFIRNMPHSLENDELEIMIANLLRSEEEATVDTYEQYPRFMKYVMADDSICPDDENVAVRTLPENIIQSIINFFRELIAFITK